MEPLRGSYINYHLIFFYGYGTATRFSPDYFLPFLPFLPFYLFTFLPNNLFT